MTEDKQPYIAIQQMNIDDIIPYDRNPRKNDHAIDKISAAIREYGFKVPVIIKSDGTIIDGHLRYKAAKKLGFKTLPVLIADDLTETQIKAFRISINRMADLADWDNELLKLEIQDLKDADFDVNLTGFNDVEIEGFEDVPDIVFDDDATKSGSGGHNVNASVSFWIYDHKITDSRDSTFEFIQNNIEKIRKIDAEHLSEAILRGIHEVLA